MDISYTKGDLFKAERPKFVFAHCVSTDCAMGAGIAKEFRARYRAMPNACKQQSPKIGDVVPYAGHDGIIYNLMTKGLYWHKPTYLSLKQTLVTLRDCMVGAGQKYLAIPKLGCGLDKLQWGEVDKMIQEVFGETDITIEVYYI